MKWKDMILSDFLSRQGNDDSDPSEIILISFNAYNILEENRNLGNLGMCKKNEGKFLIQMHSQAKTSGTTLPEVHGVRKKLDPNVRPGKQHPLSKKEVTEGPHVGQGRAGLRRKPEADCITQSSDVTGRILERSKIATGKTNIPQHTSATCDRGINNDKSFPPDVPLLPHPVHEPLQKKHNITGPQDMKTEINLDIEENSPFQEGIILELIQRPDKSFFQNPRKLKDVISSDNLVHKFLPKQVDIDKILNVIQRKVLKNTHVPIEIKEIQIQDPPQLQHRQIPTATHMGPAFTVFSSVQTKIILTSNYHSKPLPSLHKHIRTIIASLILHKGKGVEANTPTGPEITECQTLAYIGITLTLLSMMIVVLLHYRRSKFCRGYRF